MASASEAGQSSQSGRKSKNNYSYVHEEFLIIDQYHPGKEQFGPSSKCKECSKIITGTNATNLKVHLKSQHNEIYLRVLELDKDRQLRKLETTEQTSCTTPASSVLITPPRNEAACQSAPEHKKKRKSSQVML